MSSKSRWIVVLVVGFIAAIVLAFILGMFVRSGNEKAIENSQVDPMVSVAVEERSFAEKQAVVQGVVSTGETFEIKIPAGDTTSVVTATTMVAGDSVKSGSVLGRVSGRPIIALELPFVFYRDLLPGDSGDDVVALQTALQSLGAYRGKIDGVYGPATEAGVKKLYKDRGLIPPSQVDEATSSGEILGEGVEAEIGSQTQTGAASAVKTVIPAKYREIFSMPAPTAVVDAIAPIGTVLDEETPFAKLRSGDTTITARVPSSLKDDFLKGASVSVENAGETLEAQIEAVSEFRTAGVEEYNGVPGYDITVIVGEDDGLTEGLVLDVAEQSTTKAQTGLSVPLTAIRQEGDQAYVMLDDEQRTKVEVSVETMSEGWALISGSSLSAGDRVLIPSQS